ncbi:ABC-type multidrug transport system fused ATPase/permease subunit [Hymenobacter luteus]|uniref:ABC-type multidrug transport system fused ATPase/permease subunit n=2 Tax=Hymenobacter TaxID=89966 RepID=A0A7W9T1U2_9BACT|nr:MULTISPECIES: hypothetical protein [Hymenobacter]MBB4601607.1 ABC-type multidrug transport system fused ATPase/permease subunit [Hymenobacter latericoloratus]MBB6059965.1 ABC-type multidrug transport system fused ATPase/permease subunit [Hymenobacter luteus]
MRPSFLFDPNQSSVFYLVVFLTLSVLGLTAYDALNGHYSVVGSVASFLGLFVAFQSWKAADNASRKTDETLTKMQELVHETRQLIESSNAVEEQIKSAVVTISDATRELYKGFQPIMQEVAGFLAEAEGSEYLAVMTDSAAIGTFYARHHQPALNQREMRALTDRIHDLLLERARDAREFYLATLPADATPEAQPPTRDEHGLLHHFVQGVWQQFHPEAPVEEHWQEHREQHLSTLRQIHETFTTLSEHPEQRAAGLAPHQHLPVLPLQLLLRFNAEAKEPFRALVVFLGQYNLDRVAETRALQSADPELVRTFISMFESLTSLDDHPGYQQLRRQFPL